MSIISSTVISVDDVMRSVAHHLHGTWLTSADLVAQPSQPLANLRMAFCFAHDLHMTSCDILSLLKVHPLAVAIGEADPIRVFHDPLSYDLCLLNTKGCLITFAPHAHSVPFSWRPR